MKILLHIGPDATTSDRIQHVLSGRRNPLAERGVLFARTPGARNHTRLFMAVSDPDAIDTLRHHRGFDTAQAQMALRDDLLGGLQTEVDKAAPDTLILSAHQLGSSLVTLSELKRLRALLLPISQDIRVIAHLDDPARMLIRRYGAQLMEGRSRPLDLELNLVEKPDWWHAALATRPIPDPRIGQFGEVQGAVHWIDFARLVQQWDAVFGAGATHLFSLPRDCGESALADLMQTSFDLPQGIGKAGPGPLVPDPSAAWLTRRRQFNDALIRLLSKDNGHMPRQLWRKLLSEIRVDGAPVDPGSLSAISARFQGDIAALCDVHPGLNPEDMAPDAPTAAWEEADPSRGFRATQYLLAFRPRIRKAVREASAAAISGSADTEQKVRQTIDAHSPHLPQHALQNLAKLRSSPMAPHNRLGHVEDESATPFPAVSRAAPTDGSTGTVIIACMKNEAPYILEWIAYHRAIGVDRFLIYTNDCEDGTDVILDRLTALGMVEHRRNDGWKGKSPQQHALNHATEEPMIRDAEWIIHIDVDEFINVRCGDGTLSAFLERVPDATNIAMTWRLFGHNGVHRFSDDFVIDQFDTCAPKYCPKPHTVWGFKTMFRNIGAYRKLSCHRPKKLSEGYESRVKWVNGSGQDMTREVAHTGWRNSRRSIGYDLLQLNHYALRSAESFLIKRQRGRALHVDRAIGLNYWIRMDWSDVRDVTIKRNIPRLRAEYDRLLADPALAAAHARGVAWHRDRAAELHGIPEFAELYRQALTLKLNETERVAYALALDAES